MSAKTKNERKAIDQAAKALAARARADPKAKSRRKKSKDRRRAGVQLARDLSKSNVNTERSLGSLLGRVFGKQDAARLSWMLCVTDPFGGHTATIPPSLTPGVPLSVPRIYKYKFSGIAYANSVGRVYIGANADMWMPNPGKTAATVPEPYYCYLGNSTANGGSRGYPVHYTNQNYVGTSVTGSSGVSYPGSAITVAAATAGLYFVRFPDNFIPVQLNNDPGSYNACQRAVNVSLGLRARPIAPASGALVPQGTLLMVQQILGDTFTTNPVAGSGSGTIGGADAYTYLKGFSSEGGATTVTRVAGLTSEMVGLREWDVMEWPHTSGSANWLSAAAVPNQSCCYGAWVPTQTGASVVGAPQLAVIGAGMIQGQAVEWEAEYTYAFYGATSYEVNGFKGSAPVPMGDVTATAAAAATHMNISTASKAKPAQQAMLAVTQPHVSSGDFKASDAAKWIKTGMDVVEEVTGASVMELVGEGLGFLAALL